ncbi:MAG: CRP-like cAMP-binding protein [Candidatus Azotimanducaceae bacterium]|jgi:CRP/FNR family cyclic AMP-dependent transcriptional regulator
MAQSIQALFPQLEVFNFLLPEDYEVIEPYMFRYRYEAGSHVFKEGAHGGYMFFIVEGEAEVSQLVKDSKVVVAKLGPGRSLGEMSLLDGKARSATVKAISNLVLIVLKREDFNRLLDEHPQTASRVVIGLATLLSLSLRDTTRVFSEQTLSLC